MELSNVIAGVRVHEVRNISLDRHSLRQISQLVDAAKLGDLEEVGPVPMDAPTTSYYVPTVTFEDRGMRPVFGEVILKGAFGNITFRRNTAPEAAILVNILDTVCR